MKIKDILKQQLNGDYSGYVLQSIGVSKHNIKDLELYNRLKRIPPKVSYFLDRTKIDKVYKSNCYKSPLDEYYLVLSNDKTIFILEY